MLKAESKRWIAAFIAVVLITTISATPMIAQNKGLVCGLTEHQPSKECYMLDRKVPVYSCDADTRIIHIHDEATCCLSEDGASASCGFADFMTHKHDQGCYSRTGIFCCKLPEIMPHEHNEDCYKDNNTLICETEEVLGHIHTKESCYTTQKTNLCGLEEAASHQHDDTCTEISLVCQEEHEHSATCYSETLTCGEEEAEGHSHTYPCWTVDEVLTCELEESEPGHLHEQSLCYQVERILTCNKQVLRIHEHNKACFADSVCICGYLEAQHHQHKDTCIDDVEVMDEPICEREEHQHTDECFKQAEAQNASSDGFAVKASIPVKALPAGSVLSTGRVEEGTDAYAAIDDTLQEAEVEYDGFAAVDIHFELGGEEVEPDGPIQVTIESNGLIPANAAPDSIEVYHLVEEASFFGLIPATPYLEKVASSADGDAITLSSSDAGYDLIATFEVGSFSYFTVVWVEKGKTLNLHCYNSHGEKLTGTTTPINIYEFSSTGDSTNRIGNITFSTLEAEIQSLLGISFPYLYAYIYSGGEKVIINNISYNDETNDGDGNQWPGWIYKDSAYKRWLAKDGTPLGAADTADVYLVFDNVSPWVLDNPINENIHVTMYDFGSLVNPTSDAVLDFFSSPSGGAVDTHAQIDGEDPTGNTLGGGTRPTMYRTLVDGFPYVGSIGTTNAGGSLEYLFHDSEAAEYKYPLPYNFSASAGYTTDFVSNRYAMDGDGGLFFRDEETGYYSYNCSKNAAFFNGERFELYDALIAPGFASGLTVSATSNKNFWYNFFPFNQPIENENTRTKVAHPVQKDKYVYFTGHNSDTSTDNPEVTNNWFGMKMDFRFMMPQNGQVNEQDMEFYFCGDDDVWVYIDGVLVLDIGGTHGADDAYINFATGAIQSVGTGSTTLRAMYEQAYEELVDMGKIDATEVTLTQYLAENGFEGDSVTYSDYSLHKLDFFYMERGGNISYCELQFNTPVLHSHSIEIIKGLTTIPETYDGPLGDPYYEFQVLHAEDDGTPTESLFLPEGTPYTVYDLSGNLIDDTQTIDEYGIVRIKQGQRAVIEDILENSGLYYCREIVKPGIAGQYAYVEIDGVLYTFDEDVLLGEEPFYGASSPSADIAAGSADFVFTNQVKLHELGSMTVTKSVESNCPSDYTMDYKLYVTFDGTPIAEDAVYYRDNVEASVDKEGYVTIKPGEVLKFTHLLLGTKVAIYEDVSEISDVPFSVTYIGEEVSTEVSKEGPTVAVISIDDKTQRDLVIENSRTVSTVELPNTGGPGQHIPVVAGGLMLLTLAVWLPKKPKTSRSAD